VDLDQRGTIVSNAGINVRVKLRN